MTSRRGRADFIARTITGVTGAIEQTVYNEEVARTDGLLQRADPRVKVVLCLLAIVVAALSRNQIVLLALLGLTITLALSSGITPGFLVKRVLLGIPLFAAIVYLPAVVLVPGNSVLTVAAGPLHLSVSDNALRGGAIFVTRVAVSVTLAVMLVVTTRWADLLKAMRVLRIPTVFIVVLGMTYRYIFLFLQKVESLFLARASRTVGRSNDGEQRRWVGNTMGALLSKSFQTSSDVYQAMVARGFTGEMHTLSTFQMRDEDWLMASLGVVILAGALLVEQGLR